MGVYGIDYYGSARFGRDPNLIRPDFSVDPFQFMALDYGTLHLTWQKPHSTDCTQLQLVRNSHNLPQDETDGLIIFTDIVERKSNYTDNQLGSGFFYYTMWGWSQTDSLWIRCSDLIALVPINWGYSYRLYSLIPAAYRDRDSVLVDPYNPWPVDSPRPPLQRFLSLLGFEMDFIRTELESLTSLNDPLKCSGALLPLMAQQFALPNEPEIGMQQERQLIANAIHLYKLKGSSRGIGEFVSILTSFPMAQPVHHGYNVLLCRDDSIAESSVGTWQAYPPSYTHFPTLGGNTGLTLTQNPNMLTGATAVPGMTNPLELYPGFNPGPNPIYNYSGMKLLTTSASDIYVTTGRIPITDFMSSNYTGGTITWRIQIWSSVARTVKLSIIGDNGSGVPFTILAEQTFTSTLNDWQMMTITGTINPYASGLIDPVSGNGYPPNFYWIFPVIHIVGAGANEAHYVTLMGLWPCPPADIGVNTPVYDYPRDVKVVVQPQSSNLLSNPLTTFEQGFDGLASSQDPLHPTANLTCQLNIYDVDVEDPSSALYVANGTAALQVNATNPNGTVWFGLVGTWSTPLPTTPHGWFSDPNHYWFPLSTQEQPAEWFNQLWFFMEATYFSIPIAAGNWFPLPPQPIQTYNLAPYLVQPDQPYNFSVYARYTTVMDPSSAVMQIGYRWYYPDGTWTEIYANYNITTTLTRYACPPPDELWRAYPPDEAVVGIQPTSFFPFVRFPSAQYATFMLNSAMLSPGVTLQPYMDSSLYPGNPDYVEDPHGATYYYRRRAPRMGRLTAEIYRWLPIGTSHTETFGAGAILPPLDPTLW